VNVPSRWLASLCVLNFALSLSPRLIGSLRRATRFFFEGFSLAARWFCVAADNALMPPKSTFDPMTLCEIIQRAKLQFLAVF